MASPCTDGSPLACLTAACPSALLDCRALSRLGACDESFDESPLQRHLRAVIGNDSLCVRDLCRLSCGTCADQCRGGARWPAFERIDSPRLAVTTNERVCSVSRPLEIDNGIVYELQEGMHVAILQGSRWHPPSCDGTSWYKSNSSARHYVNPRVTSVNCDFSR